MRRSKNNSNPPAPNPESKEYTYGHDAKGRLLQLVGQIAAAEGVAGVIEPAGMRIAWSVPSVELRRGTIGFSATFRGRFPGDFTVISSNLDMDDYTTKLEVAGAGDYTLNDDPYVNDFHNVLRESFLAHPHELCLQALFERSQETRLVTLRSATSGELVIA